MGYKLAQAGSYGGTYLDSTQLGYCLTAAESAATYIDGFADDYHAAVIGVMTMAQESNIRNLGWGDRDSVGLFQQRPSCGWGTIAECQDPVHASRMFFQALNRVRNWQGMAYTYAAQAVQVSAYPTAYAKWQPMAEAVLKAMAVPVAELPFRPVSIHAAAQLCAKVTHGRQEFVKIEKPSRVGLFLNDALRRAGFHAPAAHIVTEQTVAAVVAFQRSRKLAPYDGIPGPVTIKELCAVPACKAHGYGPPMSWSQWPMAAAAYEGVSLPWDAVYNGGHHAGTDFPMPVGTPLYAVADGVVTSTWDDGHAGLVIFLETGPVGETACYEHLSAILTHTGARVSAGDLIARSGMTGDATGPHLHLGYLKHPVWMGNSYGDNSDTEDPLAHLPGLLPGTAVPAAPKYLLTAVLQYGRGPARAVAAAQRVLATIGAKPYKGGDPVGVFGSATLDAVIHFQAGHGLKRDGKIGPATAAAMGWRWGKA